MGRNKKRIQKDKDFHFSKPQQDQEIACLGLDGDHAVKCLSSTNLRLSKV